ncbi:peptide/nickel transport system permease protein [Streptosporangium becharense]|uniref:Peptide/nickel transport system permease protein n=1 Tax=Streptosporangium becharense TaxID=1816182 RepID=A0A7W9IMX5_9ACTN|nr:ABC transporter permease [Streptosporangium becharense]MBB2910567.1 peptide/nickel transport system permease protein [Streptosporangium becharense]MBB5823310.1 peptide/nickel transport system permease protein [Streptosporangium becharense]
MRHPWLRFALRRTAAFAVSLAALVTITFLITQLVPGDPVRASLGPTAPASLVQERRAALHLDEPVLQQYRYYVEGLVRGDFGRSFTSGQPVAEVIADRFPMTLRLALVAFVVTLLVAVPLGMAIAVLTRGGRRPGIEKSFSLTTGFVVSVPEYLMATALVALFAVTLDWLPVTGSSDWTAYVLPLVAISAVPIAVLARITRVETLKVLDQEYMRVARSKRLPRRLLYVRHALPNTLTATLTVGGMLLAGLVAGTVIVENIFSWPGLGTAIVEAIPQKNYPLVQAVALLLGTIVLLVNFVVDMLLARLDPRSLIRES